MTTPSPYSSNPGDQRPDLGKTTPASDYSSPYDAQPGGYEAPPTPGSYPPPPGNDPALAGYPPPPGYPAPSPGFPPGPGALGVDQFGRPLSDKSKVVAGILQLLIGSFGVGRFYLGYTNIGIAQIAVTWLTCGIGAIWPLIDGIMILMGNVPDAEGRTLRD